MAGPCWFEKELDLKVAQPASLFSLSGNDLLASHLISTTIRNNVTLVIRTYILYMLGLN